MCRIIAATARGKPNYRGSLAKDRQRALEPRVTPTRIKGERARCFRFDQNCLCRNRNGVFRARARETYTNRIIPNIRGAIIKYVANVPVNINRAAIQCDFN